MQIKTVRNALAALVSNLAPGVQITKTDKEEPIKRPSFKIDVLACQFSVSWVETAAEEGEPMEELIYNGEELTT